MKIRVLLPVFLQGSFLSIAPALASDYYFGASAQGTNDGTSCANAYAYDDGANGWNAPAKQQPGNTLHSCGKIGFPAGGQGLATKNAGTSGSPITLKFETGSTWSAPYWGYAITLTKDYWTVDGNNLQGTILATENGAGLAFQNGGTQGVHISGCTGCTVESLNILNLYVPQQGDEAGNSIPGVWPAAVYDDGSNMNTLVTGNNIDNVYIGVSPGCQAGPGVDKATNTTISKNTIRHTNWGIGGNPSSGLKIWGNDIADNIVWEEALDHNHHNGIYMYAEACHNVVSGMEIHDNYIHGSLGRNVTAWIFTSCGGGQGADMHGPKYYNNVLVSNDATSIADNGFFTINANDPSIYNNTIVGGTNTASDGIQINSCTGGSTQGGTSKNNIVVRTQGGFGGTGSPVVADNNVYWDVNHFYYNQLWNTFSEYVAGSGQDTHGASFDPKLTSSYQLGTGSPAVGLGANLSSLGIVGLEVGAPESFGANYACGRGCQPRPSSGGWDVGAYPFCDGGCAVADGGTPEAGGSNGDGGAGSDAMVPVGGGARDSGDASPGVGSAAVGGSGVAPTSSDGCGCRAARRDGDWLGTMVGVGLVGAMAARRRRASAL